MEEKIENLRINVAEIRKDITFLKEKFNDKPVCGMHDRVFGGLEKRIIKLETFKNRMVGAIILGNGVTAIVVAIIMKVWK